MSRWPTKPMGEVADIVRGVSFDKTEVLDEPRSGYVPILRAGNIATELNTCDDLVWVPEARVGVEQFLKRDDVAICMSSGSPTVVGKTAQLTSDWRGSVGAFCAIIRFKDLNPRFGAYWLRSPGYMAWRDSQAQGANIQNLRKAELESLPIPLPPLAEQARIVQLLDEVEALRRLRAQSDHRTADLIPALFQEMFGDPVDNPHGFPLTRLGDVLAQTPNYGTMTPARSDGGNWLCIRVANIQDEVLDLVDRKYVTLAAGMLDRHTVKDGDMLLARAIGSEQHLGKCVVAYPGKDRWAFDSHLMRVRLDTNRCEPEWLRSALRSPGGRRLFLRCTRQSAVQFNINAREFSDLTLPMPSRGLQQAFLKQVVDIRTLASQTAASRDRLDTLFQSTLHRAFEGTL